MNPTRFPNGISGPIVTDDGTRPSVIVSLTDNSGGTADNTIAAIPAATAATTDTSAASLASVNASLTAIKNDIADLTAKVNALIAAGVSVGTLPSA